MPSAQTYLMVRLLKSPSFTKFKSISILLVSTEPFSITETRFLISDGDKPIIKPCFSKYVLAPYGSNFCVIALHREPDIFSEPLVTRSFTVSACVFFAC